MAYTDGKGLGYDEDIKMGSTNGKFLVLLLGNVDEKTLWLVVGKELGSLYGSFDVSNNGKLEVLFIGEYLEYTDGKSLGYDKGIKLGSNDGKVISIILGNAYVITLGIDVVT